VHVRVGSAVGLAGRPGAVEGLGGQALVVVPEPLLPDAQRLVEQHPSALEAGHGRRRPGQDDEGVHVRGLRVVVRTGAHRGSPAAVLGVVQGPLAQGRHPVPGELGRARGTEQGGQAEDVGHPGTDPGLDRVVGQHRPVVAQVPEPAGHPGAGSEGEQPVE
jgi:hypothetical protein